jgi:RimJ/RimL family protein N-acetyltransferase
MGPKVPSLADGVVALRPPEPDDVDAITAACQDPEIPRFTLVPSPYTRANAVEHVRRSRRAWRDGTAYAFVITDAVDGTLLGSIGLPRLSSERNAGEIGYWVAKEARGRGVATRATRLVAGWALDELGLSRLDLVADVDNPGSQRVAERAGFTREGVLRSWFVHDDRRRDVVMFSLLPEDLPG